MSDNSNDLPSNVIPLFKPEEDVPELRTMTPEEGKRIIDTFAELEALEEDEGDEDTSNH